MWNSVQMTQFSRFFYWNRTLEKLHVPQQTVFTLFKPDSMRCCSFQALQNTFGAFLMSIRWIVVELAWQTKCSVHIWLSIDCQPIWTFKNGLTCVNRFFLQWEVLVLLFDLVNVVSRPTMQRWFGSHVRQIKFPQQKLVGRHGMLSHLHHLWPDCISVPRTNWHYPWSPPWLLILLCHQTIVLIF